MRFYLSYFKLRFISGLQYRFAAVTGIATQFFFGIVIIMVYLAFYESGDATTPMSLSELVSYLWLNQIFYSLLTMEYKDREIIEMIKKGDLAYELARPKNIYFMWFFKILGQRLSMVFLRSIPFVMIILVLPVPYRLAMPESIIHFLLFLIAISIGTLLMTSIITMYNVITLKTMDEKGVTNIFAAVADLFSGGFVPTPFFPNFLQVVGNFLPFKYVCDLPYRIYSGNVDVSVGFTGIIIQIFWTLLLTFLGYILTTKLLKRVVVQGG